MPNRDFEIVEHIGVIRSYPTGWNKEINIISWDMNTPKVDIRDWNPEHNFYSRGITLSDNEMDKMIEKYLDWKAR